MRTALYRHFDAAGQLLYVGISNDALRRLCQHKDRSSWYAQIARVDVQWLGSRQAALGAESAAIAAERPRWNVRGNRNKSPVVPKRIGSGILHCGSGRIDGWYFGDPDPHMLGWWRVTFPRDRFEPIRPTPGLQNWIEMPLRSGEWSDWSATPPDWAAADAFDRQAEVAA